MAHRYNSLNGRKEPKPTASDRTWFRFRVRHDEETSLDEQRISRREEVKQSIREWLSRQKAKMVKKGDPNG